MIYEMIFTYVYVVPPVPPTLTIEVLNATATDGTRVLAHIGSFVSVACKMTEAYTEGNLQIHWSTDSQIGDISTIRPSEIELQLVIDNVTREDESRYTCHAVNNLGSTLMSVNIVVGTVPEPLRINATSFNNTLIVTWEHVQNTTEDHDQQITAHYVQYVSVNNSNNVAVVERFPASAQFATFRNVDHNVEYIVTMWSENILGNSSESNSVSVVIIGMLDIAINYLVMATQIQLHITTVQLT